MCGIVGLKPTYGRVSRHGLIAMASSLDQIGPLTKNVYDAALVLNTICGQDVFDSTTVPKNVPDFTKNLKEDVRGLRVGVPKEFFGPTPHLVSGDLVYIQIWDPMTFILIKNKTLADAYRKHFEFMWKTAKPMGKGESK